MFCGEQLWGYGIETIQQRDEIILWLNPEFAKNLAVHAIHANIPFQIYREEEYTVMTFYDQDLDKILRCDVRLKSFVKD